jgi:hypothetical protein
MKGKDYDRHQDPGSRPISEEEVIEMIFSRWGAKLGGFVIIVFAAYALSTLIFGF